MKIKLAPLEFRVVVLADEIDEKVGGGLIVKAETTKVQDRRTQTKGTVVAMSDVAFKHFEGSVPKVGDRVEFAMYSGQFYVEDEVEYRIINDNDIVGILREDV